MGSDLFFTSAVDWSARSPSMICSRLHNEIITLKCSLIRTGENILMGVSFC